MLKQVSMQNATQSATVCINLFLPITIMELHSLGNGLFAIQTSIPDMGLIVFAMLHQ